MTTARTIPSVSLIGESTLLGNLLGHHSPIQGVAIYGDRLFATHYHSPIGNDKASPEPGTLAVLDRVSLAEVARIPVGWHPRQVVVNPTARKIYVQNYGAASHSVSIIGLDSLQPEGELKIGFGLVGLAVDTLANVLYVLVDSTGEVVAYDCSSHAEMARTTVGWGLTDAAVDEANRWLYVARHTNTPVVDEIVVVDTSSPWPTPPATPWPSVQLGPHAQPHRVVFDSGTNRLYVMTLGATGGFPPGLVEIDRGTAAQRTITQGGPVALSLDPFHGLVHLLTNNALTSFDTGTHTALAPQMLTASLLTGLAVDRETSAVAVGDRGGRITLIHPDVAFGAAPHAPPGAPLAVVAHDGVMDLFVAGNDDRGRMAHWSDDTDWDFTQGWVELPDTVPAGTPLAALSRFEGQWELYAVLADHQLWALAGNAAGATSGWEPLGGHFPLRSHLTAVSRHSGERLVFAVGNDGVVYSVGGNEDTTSSLPITGGPPVPPGTPITAISRKPDHWDLFVLADDGQVWTTWWSTGDGFGGWGSIGGSFPPGTPITVVARRRDHLDLFAVRDDGQVVTQWWGSDPGWSGWGVVSHEGNEAPLGAQVTAVARNADSLDLFVTRADQQVHTNQWAGNWSGWRAVGGRVSRIGAPLAACPRTDQWMHICWAAEGGSVETGWWNRVQPNGGWSLDNGVRLRVPTQSVRFDEEVKTETSNLSGSVTTRLWRTGAFLVSGHIHGSGWDPYRFITQSAILTPTGFAVANHHRGRVDGTGSEPFPWDPKPDRDHWWNDVGISPVVAAAYDDLASGDPVANCQHKNIGLGGGIQDLVEGVFEGFLDPLILDPARKLTRAVAALGHELHQLLRLPEFLPGPQSVFTYSGAFGWLSGLGFITPVLPWDAEIGSSLDPFVEHREMELDEYQFVNRVFGGTLPDREHILLTDALGLKKHPFSPNAKGRAFVLPSSDDGPIIVNIGDAFKNPTTFVKDNYPKPGQLLIHELTHVWHIHNTPMSRREWVARGINDGNYDPPPPNTSWSDFGVEQKASTVDQWYEQHVDEGLDSRAALNDPYYKFIHLVRTRVTGD